MTLCAQPHGYASGSPLWCTFPLMPSDALLVHHAAQVLLAGASRALLPSTHPSQVLLAEAWASDPFFTGISIASCHPGGAVAL